MSDRQTHPSVLLMCLSCHNNDIREDQSECRRCNQSSMPAVLCHLSMCRTEEERERGREGLPPPHPPTQSPSPPRPSLFPVTPGRLSKMGVATLVTRLPASPANKGSSVRAAATRCRPASSSGPRAQLLLYEGSQSEPRPGSEPAQDTALHCTAQPSFPNNTSRSFLNVFIFPDSS